MEAAALLDAFDLLGLDAAATEAEIRTAYRKRSLQLHPDKARDIPPELAADRFHRLTLAYEQLLDPAVRANLAQKMEHERQRRERHAAFDTRRQQMTADLEAREADDRERRAQREQHARARARTIAMLREEGRAMRIEKHEQMLKAWQAHAQAEPAKRRLDEDTPKKPLLGAADAPVLLRFPSTQYDEMGGDALYTMPLASPLAAALATAYGPLTALTVKPKKRGEVAALATFADIAAAWRAVQDGQQMRCAHPLLGDSWMGWGEPNFKERTSVPAWITSWVAQGTAPAEADTARAATPAPPTHNAIDTAYEAQTMARLYRAAHTSAA